MLQSPISEPASKQIGLNNQKDAAVQSPISEPTSKQNGLNNKKDAAVTYIWAGKQTKWPK